MSINLTEAVFNAGVVGCGGAGFPTHVKYANPTESFLINGAECEPLLRTDRYLMKAFPEKLVEGTYTIGTHLKAKKIVIVLKKTYLEEIVALEAAIVSLGLPVEIFKLDSFYPAGDEQVMIKEVLGVSVPPAGIPIDVGVVVSNVATVLAVADALKGKPLTHRTLTVTGHVNEPQILNVPIGTSIRECIEQAIPKLKEPYGVVLGGPLMGEVVESSQLDNLFVEKTTSGLIVIPLEHYLVNSRDITVEHMVNRAKSACIQCTYCTELCPRFLIGHPLEPHRVMGILGGAGSIEKAADNPKAIQALLCCECGICQQFSCPMELQPMRVNKAFKTGVSQAGAELS